MAVTSTNTNSKNDTKYARRRSIWKGRRHQLKNTVDDLKARHVDMLVHEYVGNMRKVREKFRTDWECDIKAVRIAPSRIFGRGTWNIQTPSERLVNIFPTSVRGDLALVWEDFILAAAKRAGSSDGLAADSDEDVRTIYTGEVLIVIAVDLGGGFDLIVSKYGYGLGGYGKHHFYHWQARAEGYDGFVNVDDHRDDDLGITLYVRR